MAQPEPCAVQYGFDAPSVTAPHLHSTHVAAHSNVNPAALFGYSAAASGMASPFAPTTGGGGGVGMYGSSSVLSDADLDLENILASFNNAASAQDSAGGNLPQGYMGAPFAGLQSGLRHQSPLPPVNENGGQQTAADVGEFFSQPPPKARRGSSNEYGTPNTNTTYGASPSDTFATPSTSSKRSVSQERTGRLGRSSSAGGVGKAPRQTSRSRSARRTSSAATAGYQDRTEAKERGRDRERSTQRGGEVVDKASPASNLGTPGASAAATPGANSTSNPPPAAVGIPTANAATMPPPHPYAMSMPAFVHPASYGAHAASMPTHAVNGGWFPHPHPSSAGAIPLPGMHHPALAAGGGGAAAFASQHFMAPHLHHHPHHPMTFDPLTGWRPTVGPLPASAPPAADPGAARPTNPPSSSATTTTTTAAAASKKDAVPAPPANTSGSKKNKGLEDVQEEDDGKGEPLTDKRRKRRESHNAVERRRRDNINDRIAELASLLPEAFQVGAPQPPPPLSASSSTRDEPNGGGGPGSPAIGSLSLMSPGPFGSASPTSFHSVSGAAYMAAAAAAASSSSAQQQKATAGGLSAQAQAAAQKPNKGAVLAKSVDYIRYLQQVVELQQQQAAELQRQNAELRRAVDASPSPPPLSSSRSKYLPPQPPCFPPHVHSVSASTDTSASVSRQAGSPDTGGGSRSVQFPPPSAGLGTNANVSTRNGGKRRSGGGAGSGSWTLSGDDHLRRRDDDRDDDRDDEGDDYRSEDQEDPDNDDDRGGDGGGAFTPECEGPDGIDCEKGWDAMLAAGGMHVLKMEEDDP